MSGKSGVDAAKGESGVVSYCCAECFSPLPSKGKCPNCGSNNNKKIVTGDLGPITDIAKVSSEIATGSSGYKLR